MREDYSYRQSKTEGDTVKPVLSGNSKIDKTTILMTNGSLMQNFRPALSDNWS